MVTGKVEKQQAGELDIKQELLSFEKRILESVQELLSQAVNGNGQQDEDGEPPGKVQRARIARELKIDDHVRYRDDPKNLHRNTRLFSSSIPVIMDIEQMNCCMDPTDDRDPDEVMVQTYEQLMISFKGLGRAEDTNTLAVLLRSQMDQREEIRGDGL